VKDLKINDVCSRGLLAAKKLFVAFPYRYVFLFSFFCWSNLIFPPEVFAPNKPWKWFAVFFLK
jgi:hypothetical protein